MPAGQAHQGKMHTMGADYPGQVWVVDTLMVHETHTGEKYLMAGTDQFTKSWELRAIRDDTATSYVELYYNQIFPRWGAVHMIRTDRGSAFISEVSKEATKLMVTLQVLGAAEHPQWARQQERPN